MKKGDLVTDTVLSVTTACFWLQYVLLACLFVLIPQNQCQLAAPMKGEELNVTVQPLKLPFSCHLV